MKLLELNCERENNALEKKATDTARHECIAENYSLGEGALFSLIDDDKQQRRAKQRFFFSFIYNREFEVEAYSVQLRSLSEIQCNFVVATSVK